MGERRVRFTLWGEDPIGKTNMKQSVVLAVVAFACAGAAVAAEFTWTGGASGDWTTPGNWDVGAGYPKAGDTAKFNETVTIAGSDINIGGEEGTTDALTIDIADGKTLTIDASISGEGGVTRSGEGTLKLNRANPFKGEYLSRNASAQAKGRTYVYNQDALGTKSANFREDPVPAGTKNYAPLFIDAGGGTFTFSVPIRICNNNNDMSDGLNLANGSVIFTKSVVAPARFHGSISKVTEIRFKEKFSAGGWCDMGWGGCRIYYEKGFTSGGSTWLNSGSSSSTTIYFLSQDNNIYFGTYGPGNATYVCCTNDVFKDSNVANPRGLGWQVGDGSQKSVSKLDLGGFDQHYKAGLVRGSVIDSKNYGYTSETPAQVILAGANTTDIAFNGNFWGAAGLTWNPNNGTTEFILSNVVSMTKGSLRALSGTIRLSDGSSFSRLAEIEIGGTGSFVLNDDAGTYTFASNILVAAGGALAIPAGRTVSCYTCFDENGQLTNGLYKTGAAGAPAFLSGDGTLEVNSAPLFKWVGAAGGNWSEDANWEAGVKPIAGARVQLDAGASVTLDEPTPRLAQLTLLNATLRVGEGFDTVKIDADKVVVGVGGVITTTGAFATAPDAPASRVWITCGDLDVAAGGAIDVSNCGWAGGTDGVPGLMNVKGIGFGPGAAPYLSYDAMMGSGHGGVGAVADISAGYSTNADPELDRCRVGLTYDDPYAPVLPGSGATLGGTTFAGGGAIRVDATGSVTVNGSVLANSPDARSDSARGSGGSVWISCVTFAGSGAVEAKGGSPMYGGYPGFLSYYAENASVHASSPRAGGGGMIRVECEAVGDLTGLKISAAPGYFLGNDKGSGKLTAVNYDKYRIDADLGTLTFSNNLILDALLGKGLSGRLVGVTNYTYATDMDWTWGHVRFAGEGATVAFGGNVTISGEDSRLEIGGVETRLDRRLLVPNRFGGTKLNSCTIAGDLTLNGGAFDIRAAETNAANGLAWGGEVKIDGNLTVGEKGWLYPWCDPITLGAPHFTVGGAFTVAVGGTVSADRRGGSAGGGSGSLASDQRGWAQSMSCTSYGLGRSNSAGASHGGAGGKYASVSNDLVIADGSPSTVKLPDEWTASYPGAGGGSDGFGAGGLGGGLVYVESQGAMTIDGTISADGCCGYYSSLGSTESPYIYCRLGSGAGGGVYLSGASLTGSGSIFARGGNAISGSVTGTGASAGTTYTYAAACGGGGRIVVRTGADVVGKSKLLKDTSADYRSDAVVQELVSFNGKISADGGVNIWSVTGKTTKPPQVDVTHGGDGTVRFLRSIPAPGVLLFVR